VHDLKSLMNPREILTSENTLKRIETVCRRHFSDENEIIECNLFIIDCLKEDDYKRLRAFSGKSSPTTYLYTLVNRLVTDFRRRKYGRRRIPKRVSDLGAWAEAVYRYVCWQKYSYDDAFDFLLLDGLYDGGYEEFSKKVEPIRQAPCPENPKFLSSDDAAAGGMRNRAATQENPLDALIEKLDREKRMAAVAAIQETTAGLSQQDQLLIKLVYGSDLSAAKAGRVVGLSPAAARKKLKKLLIQFREALLSKGIREQ